MTKHTIAAAFSLFFGTTVAYGQQALTDCQRAVSQQFGLSQLTVRVTPGPQTPGPPTVVNWQTTQGQRRSGYCLVDPMRGRTVKVEEGAYQPASAATSSAGSLDRGRFREMSDEASGRGTVRVFGRRVSIDEASVILMQNGRFAITLSGDERFRYRGYWRQVDDDEVQLSIRSAPGGAAKGEGLIRLRDGQFDDIQLDAGQSGTAIFDVTGDYHTVAWGNRGRGRGRGRGNARNADWRNSNFAQGDEMTAAAQGRGSITMFGRRENVSRAEVALLSEDDFVITLIGDESHIFRGNWRLVDEDEVELSIRQTPEGPAMGDGLIRLRAGRFDDIELDMGSRGSAIFDVTGGYRSFDATEEMRRWSPGQPVSGSEQFDEMSATAEGRGTVTLSRSRENVSKAEVSLIPNGDFIITLSGDERHRFRGEWEQINSREVQLTVLRTPSGSERGDGIMRLKNGRFEEIELDAGSQGAAVFEVTGDYRDFTKPNDGQSGGSKITAPKWAENSVQAPEWQPKAPLITIVGSGTVVRSDWGRRDIEAMEIFLQEDGELKLKIFGSGFEGVLTGSWSREQSDTPGRFTYRLDIDEAFDQRASGSGIVIADARGRPQWLDVNGNYRGRQSYELQFSPQ